MPLSGDQSLPVFDDCKAGHATAGTRQRPQLRAVVEIPDLDHSIPRTRDGKPAVRCDGHGFDGNAVTAERLDLLAACHVPDLDVSPACAVHDPAIVGGEGEDSSGPKVERLLEL